MKRAVILMLLLAFVAVIAIANINRKSENKIEKKTEQKTEKKKQCKRTCLFS